MRGRLIQTLAATVVAVLLGATLSCAKDPRYSPRTVSPLPSPHRHSSPSTTVGTSDEEQVRSIYLEFAVKNWAAERLPPEDRRVYLARWMTEPALSRFVVGMERLRRQGRLDVGTSVPHVFAVSIRRSTALVDDCSDNSNLRTIDKAGRVVDRGKRNTWYITTLKRTAAGWRVSDTRRKEQSCVGK